MTLTAIRPHALGLVADARETVGRIHTEPPASSSSAELAEMVVELSALAAQVDGLRLAHAGEADARGVAHESADTGADAWLARLTGEPREVMAGGLWGARMLRETCHHTWSALEDGRLRLSQAKAIVRAVAKAPSHVTAEQLAAAEESLVAMATGAGTRSGRALDARRLRREARRMFEGILPPDEVDALESAQLRAEEARAEHDTWLMVHDNGDGTMSGRFLLPELHGHLLVHALERLTSPRPLSRRRDGAVVTDPTADRLSRAEHFGSAFCELLEHLPADGHDRTAVTLLVTLDLDALVSGVGAARLDTGVRISAGEARRLACGAGLLPAVLGGESLPLDLGRTRRLHTRAQRTALAVVHDLCAVEGCQRPFAWCEIHHPHAWGRGGDTDLANALPLCGHHHRRAHDDRWDLRRHAGGDYRFHRRR